MPIKVISLQFHQSLLHFTSNLQFLVFVLNSVFQASFHHGFEFNSGFGGNGSVRFENALWKPTLCAWLCFCTMSAGSSTGHQLGNTQTNLRILFYSALWLLYFVLFIANLGLLYYTVSRRVDDYKSTACHFHYWFVLCFILVCCSFSCFRLMCRLSASLICTFRRLLVCLHSCLVFSSIGFCNDGVDIRRASWSMVEAWTSPVSVCLSSLVWFMLFVYFRSSFCMWLDCAFRFAIMIMGDALFFTAFTAVLASWCVHSHARSGWIVFCVLWFCALQDWHFGWLVCFATAVSCARHEGVHRHECVCLRVQSRRVCARSAGCTRFPRFVVAVLLFHSHVFGVLGDGGDDIQGGLRVYTYMVVAFMNIFGVFGCNSIVFSHNVYS